MTNYIDLGNTQIAHRQIGTGPDILFIHGWPLHSETFRYIVPEMSKHFTCHLVDLPGAGKTKWGKGTSITMRAHTKTLQQVVDKLRLETYGILSHDSGGIMARYLAASHQEKVVGLVLGNTEFPNHRSDTLLRFVNGLSLPGMELLLPIVLRSKWMRKSAIFGGSLFYDIDQVEGEFGDLFLRNMITDREAVAGQLKLIRVWDWEYIAGLSAIHAELKIPVQLIWGEDDAIFPVKYAKEMQQEFGGPTELHVLTKTKLFPHEEKPAIFAEHAIRFFEKRFEPQMTPIDKGR
ncbi:MAG: alpha/beta hydrolase [Chloroflexota bacterium]